MPGVDILARLGTGEWISTDGQKLVHAMQRARFDLMAIASARALAGDTLAGNAETKAAVDVAPLLRGWCVINPASPERSSEEMRRYCSSPRWLGALLDPTRFNQRLTSTSTKEVINSYRRYAKPLMVLAPDAATIADLDTVAAEINTVKFIAVGAGGPAWTDGMVAAKRNTNLFLEPFTGGPHVGKIEALIETLGPHRVLFGSNYPVENPGAALGLLLESKISDAEKQSILANNAIKLFGLTRAT
jgi:predicted TIM-barrel fold metal-dependent hydrolase